ncbi:pyruvate dehydrogenase phosphatase regulatory subunit, mitochondrial-like isoform X2 [Varroa destructor]|uniref:Pyruvate dehydrogenase phosphatase regulatory subunit, mitochondrial n=1 Tax=Varroa destructor TaxID=109461 RepID=A0A7M7KNU4_VARDE|nr:pyruvate dehydrogenase phosphatase regulatory subunit, mitochondrial-like isoform X2 [Varroa destructor]
MRSIKGLRRALSPGPCGVARRCMASDHTIWEPHASSLNLADDHHLIRDAQVPTSAQVVICGGGIVGTSVAYHLAKIHGITDVLLVDRGKIGGGSTRFGASLLSQIKNRTIESRMSKYSIELYKQLQDMGHQTGWKQCGSLHLARTKERLLAFRRMAAVAKSMDVDARIIMPKEAQELSPNIATERLEGALWCPVDGVADTHALCNILAGEAEKLGVKVVEGFFINRILSDPQTNKVTGVESNFGRTDCEYFVNAAGYFGRLIGKLSNPPVKIPLYPCEHYFLHTKPVPGINENMPVIHDYDGNFYIRVKDGKYIAGGFENHSKPVDFDNLPAIGRGLLPEDWDQFSVLLNEMLFRIPELVNVEVDRLYNSPESFTPDGRWLVGESAELRNYFVASGMKSIGIEAAGGVGRVTASWIVNGEPHQDLWDVDIKRFIGLHNNKQFLKERATEVPGLYYRMPYPLLEFETGRQLRMSPIYPRLRDAGAMFGQTMGYERPGYYDPEYKDKSLKDARVSHTKTFFKPPYFDLVQSEYEATRERVALIDYSSFTKLEITSPGDEVVTLLQNLCSNDVDIPVGHIVNTGMQNEQGGYENDCSLVRLAPNKFMIVCPTRQQQRAQTYLRWHIGDKPIWVADLTSMYTAICVIGPNSRDLMQQLTGLKMGIKDFPYFTYKECDVWMASGVRMLHMTHTGEMGWVMYIPNEYALHVYDRLVDIGKDYGLQHVGYIAMKTLRIEKFFGFWGQDFNRTTTPLECGRAFRVKFEKDNFIGKAALIKQKDQGVKRRFVQLLLKDHDYETDPWPWGGEPIYLNDRVVGRVTTTAYGFTLSTHIDIGGLMVNAKANIHSPALAYKGISKERTYFATQ